MPKLFVASHCTHDQTQTTYRTLRSDVVTSDALKFHAAHEEPRTIPELDPPLPRSVRRESHRLSATNVKLSRHTSFPRTVYYLPRETRPRRRVRPKNAESSVPSGDLEPGPVRQRATTKSLSKPRASPRSSATISLRVSRILRLAKSANLKNALTSARRSSSFTDSMISSSSFFFFLATNS